MNRQEELLLRSFQLDLHLRREDDKTTRYTLTKVNAAVMSSSDFETQEEVEDELERRLKKVADLLPDVFYLDGVGISRYGETIGDIKCSEETAIQSIKVSDVWADGMPLPDSMSFPGDDEWVVTPIGLDIPEDIIYIRILSVSPEEAASQIEGKILDGVEGV